MARPSKRDPVDPTTHPTCAKCQQKHLRKQQTGDGPIWYETCTAHRRDGTPCRKYPLNGARVCERDGAAQGTPARDLAKRRLIEDDIRKTMSSSLVHVDTDRLQSDPIQGLMWEVAMSAQTVDWLALQIADLHVPRPAETGPLKDVIGMTDDGKEIRAQSRSSLWGVGAFGELKAHVLYQMWTDERDRHARFCALAVKAGVSERMVAIAENQGQQIIQAFTYVIDNMPDATAAQRVAMRSLSAKALRMLGPGAAAAIPTTATG